MPRLNWLLRVASVLAIVLAGCGAEKDRDASNGTVRVPVAVSHKPYREKVATKQSASQYSISELRGVWIFQGEEVRFGKR